MSNSKLYSLITALALTGCSTAHRPPPTDVRLIPNDCANRHLIENYLTQQAQQPRSTFETEKDYERSRAEIRHRIWGMRYNCNPV